VPSSPSPRLSRRTALGALGLATVGIGSSACSVDPGGTPSGPRTIRSAELTPDVRLAVELVAGLQRAVAVTSAAIHRHPPLRASLAPLLAAQRAHLELLDRAVPAHARSAASSVVVRAEPTRQAARAHVVRTAIARRDALNAAAARAESGPFARVLASMGAGLTQRLVVLGAAR
jgi:hypothetical protein